jgi:hypothetical protein
MICYLSIGKLRKLSKVIKTSLFLIGTLWLLYSIHDLLLIVSNIARNNNLNPIAKLEMI